MPRLSSLYVCQQCGYQAPSFLGRCPECGSWGSLVEQVSSRQPSASGNRHSAGGAQVVNLSEVDQQQYQRLSSGIEEFDRVLGGGIVVGSVVLVSGEPGIGKSTLLTQLALNVADSLYVAGEESAQQIKIRSERIKPGVNLKILNEVDVDLILATLESLRPKLVIIDSIQTLQTQDLDSVAGSISQVRESAHRLQRVAKALHIPILLVGHITKEGAIAGPKTLEHLVDVVLSMEGDPVSNFRMLRASKNRFGPTDEVGIFEMEESGLTEVQNPSRLFLAQKVDAPGSAVVATMNGYRPILVEVQALVTKSFLPSPRRVGSGVDYNRLQLLVAVIQKRLGMPLFDQDIFVNVTGGLKVVEPAADLGICMSIVSSFKDQKIKAMTIFMGEVGLLGELRAVRNLDKRSSEAKNLGYTQIISPQNAKSLHEVVKISLDNMTKSS